MLPTDTDLLWHSLADSVNRNRGVLRLWTRAIYGKLAVKYGCCSSQSVDASCSL